MYLIIITDKPQSARKMYHIKNPRRSLNILKVKHQSYHTLLRGTIKYPKLNMTLVITNTVSPRANIHQIARLNKQPVTMEGLVITFKLPKRRAHWKETPTGVCLQARSRKTVLQANYIGLTLSLWCTKSISLWTLDKITNSPQAYLKMHIHTNNLNISQWKPRQLKDCLQRKEF
jgi:hypothetical protein